MLTRSRSSRYASPPDEEVPLDAHLAMVVPGTAPVPERDEPVRDPAFLYASGCRSTGAACSLPQQGASRCRPAARVLADDRRHTCSDGLRAAGGPEAPRHTVAGSRARDCYAAGTVPRRANALCVSELG